MNMKISILTLLGILIVMNSTVNAEKEKGIIGRIYENNLPVIYKFVNEMPSAKIREKFQWLTVISWKYDGSYNNGMPLENEHQEMIKLETAIQEGVENIGICRHAYSRTGNELKELIYYIHDQAEFLAALNKTLSGHPRYPIDISFYKDEKWEDFQRILNNFAKAANKANSADAKSRAAD